MAINNEKSKLAEKLINPNWVMYYHIMGNSLEAHYFDQSEITIPNIEHNREALNRKIIAGILEEYESIKELFKTVLGIGITTWIFFNMLIPLPTILSIIINSLGVVVFGNTFSLFKFILKELSVLEYVSAHLEEINQMLTHEDILQLKSYKYDAYMEHGGITVGNLRLFENDKILTKVRRERNGKRRH